MAGTVTLGFLLVVGSSGPVSADQPATELVDVTSTRVGRLEAARVAERRAARGQVTRTGDLRVYRFAPGAFVVAPSRVPLLGATARRLPAGGVRVEVGIRVAAPSTLPGAPARSPSLAAAGGPSWTWVDGECFDALYTAFGYSVSCFALSRVVADGSATRDYWALEQWSLTGPNFHNGITPNSRIYDSWVATQRAVGSPAMTWIDWSPRSDTSGACQTVGLSVSALKLPLSGTFEMCEQWDATWYAEAGRFKNQWRCGCLYPFGVAWDREVAYLIAVGVPNGTFPSWTLSQGFLAF